MSTNKFIADVQSAPDTRNLAIQQVGIKSLKHPVLIEDIDFLGNPYQFHSIATFNMFVNLPADRKGTHMSRFLTLLNDEDNVLLSLAKLPGLIDTLLVRLEAQSASLEAQFPFFLRKEAPVSKVQSFMDYDVTLKARVINEKIECGINLVVPVATVCPCSKEISEYGAHNQRSHVTLDAWFLESASITRLIQLIEREASCELYSALKRVDEKYLTELAYENPKFVEDLVRDIAVRLDDECKFSYYKIASENFESIHNHSAYAEIVYP